MRERLTGSDARFLIFCGLLLAATIWFSASFFYRAFPEASIDFQVTSRQAETLAQKFLASLGQNSSGYRHAARFDFDDESKTFLEREIGLERANRLMGTRVRLWRWSHRWFRPQQKEEYRVEVTPRGETVGFSHLIPEAAPRPSLAPEQARAAAENFLRGSMGRDPAALDFVEASSLTRPARTDHVFTWKERDFNIQDATYRLEVRVLGSEIGGYREYLKIPETWLRDYQRLRSRNETAQSVDTAVMLLLIVGMLIVLLRRIMARDVHWKLAAGFGSTGALLLFLSAWNSRPLAEFGYPTTDSYSSFFARWLLQAILSALAGGGLIFLLTAAAEPIYRQSYGARIALGNLFRMRGLRTKSFFKGAVLGLTLTGVFVAYQTAFYLIAYRYGAWSPADVPYSDLLNTTFPWLFVLLGGFMPAVSEEFVFRMFAIPFLSRLSRSVWLGLLLAGFTWGFGHAGYPQQPFYIRGVEVGIGGVILGLVMLRWGILPTLIWHYSVDAMYSALLLMRSHNLYFALSGAASAGIMVLPLAIAWIAYLRHKGFEPEAGLTNADESSAAPPEPEREPEPAPLTGYHPWPKTVVIAAVAAIVVALAFLLVPAQRFGEEPRFALDSAQATQNAGKFLRDLGMDPAAFRHVAYPSSQFSGRVAKYFVARRPVSYLQQAYARYLPLRVWTVRYYKPLEKEEVWAAIHPETGAVASFGHSLPEDQPGADLPAHQAQRIAADYLRSRGFDLNTLQLKENTSEKKKARRDYTLVWEARPGDPRNLDEAHFRVRIDIAGDRVTSLSTFWKLPETFERERSQRNALSIAVIVVLLGFIIAGVVIAVLQLVRATRSHDLRWRSALWLALPATLLVALGQLAQLPQAFREYNTALSLETFRILIATGLLMSVVGAFLALTFAAALILALHPDALQALRAKARRLMARDALICAGLALALASFNGHLARFLQDRLHAQALLSAGVSDLIGSGVPALSAIGSAVFGAFFDLAFLALGVYVLQRLRARPAILVVVAILAVVVGVSSEVHTAGEFFLQAVTSAVGLGLIAWFTFGFARHNLLAFALAAWTWSLERRALVLLSQPAASLQLQGWIVVAVLVVTLLCAVLPLVRREA